MYLVERELAQIFDKAFFFLSCQLNKEMICCGDEFGS